MVGQGATGAVGDGQTAWSFSSGRYYTIQDICGVPLAPDQESSTVGGKREINL